MPPTQTKSAASNGSAKPKGSKSTPASTVTSSPKATEQDQGPASVSGSGRPDKATYDAEQEKIKSEIDSLQTKLAAVREKISLVTKSGSGPGNDKRTTLRAELDSIRGQQSTNKSSRGKILDQLKSIQDGIQKKIKDLQAAKGKTTFKTVAEVDAHVKNLEKQVESGSMKLADEKRALQEISQARRTRRTVENFQADQDSIEADRRAADELRKQLDDPESKAISDRYEVIKAELDELKKEADEAYAGRNKLFEERDGLQAQINALFNEKRESAQRFREANDRYWAKLNEDRARRAERARVQRAAEENQKKIDIAERLREEASVPAFQAQIEDCQTLIDALSGKSTGILSSATLPARTDVAGVPKLEPRKVEGAEDGLVARKKKGEEEESYFVGKSKKGKRSNAKSAPAEPSANSQLNLPLPTLAALLSLSIPPPTSPADVPRVIEDLTTKKTWFEANQARVTAENLAKAEADIARLTNGAKVDSKVDPTAAVVPPNGDGEQPPEPAPTPADKPIPEVEGQVQETLDSVNEEIIE
ncbi:hypothetical protein BJ138DRAFT_1133450 [Hygrophoropsis aurantiaca]|uniref:Uncharacterized protein n=1 Tax=Hygrophoropsis aurantiaca TaxID=72124 RepID=A0ACB8AMX5_9AGAM|nr:hypothetical protein BJ138DRAFT_1133450 [Hygrophoropsis aurantiaca]